MGNVILMTSMSNWHSTPLGKLYRRYRENPNLGRLTTWATMTSRGTLVTVSWEYVSRLNFSGEDCSYFTPVTEAKTKAPWCLVHSIFDGPNHCYDPFACTDDYAKRALRIAAALEGA